MDKTACPEHRRQGYYLSSGQWTCKACHLPESAHETIAETIARKTGA